MVNFTIYLIGVVFYLCLHILCYDMILQKIKLRKNYRQEVLSEKTTIIIFNIIYILCGFLCLFSWVGFAGLFLYNCIKDLK